MRKGETLEQEAARKAAEAALPAKIEAVGRRLDVCNCVLRALLDGLRRQRNCGGENSGRLE